MADEYKVIEVEQADGSIKYQVEGFEKLFDTKDEAKKWALSKALESASDMPDQRKGKGNLYRTKSEKAQKDAESKSKKKNQSKAGKK